MTRSSRRCFVLVDWWSQVRSQFNKGKSRSPGAKSETALREVEKLVEKSLMIETEQPRRWEICLRLYAGWMRGGTPTEALRDYDFLFNGYAKRRRLGGELTTAIFLPSSIGLARGDRLVSDITGKRVDKTLGIHFPFTSRSECRCLLCSHLDHIAPDGFKCDRIVEKQVDASIVADAITFSVDDEKPKIIIISNDDDVMPGLIAGEALGGDISLVNTVQKLHKHASQMNDLIAGPRELGL